MRCQKVMATIIATTVAVLTLLQATLVYCFQIYFVDIGRDERTGAIYRVKQVNPYLVKNEPCVFNSNTKEILGAVPNNTNFLDDEVVSNLTRIGIREFEQRCPQVKTQTQRLQRQFHNNRSTFSIHISLFTEESWARYQQGSYFSDEVYATYVVSPAGDIELQSMTNKVQQRAAKAARNTPHQATQAIERTIEGFTLGMSSSDATRLLTSGIQKGQFKVEITKDLVGREFPMISDYPGSLPGLDVPTKKSWIFSTAAAKGIQLFFYESKLYWIGIDPYAREKLRTALTEKYGPPFKLSSPRHCGGSADAWTDNRTTINYCGFGRFVRLKDIDLVLNYLDQQLVSQMENDATQTRQKQEGEERRKAESLPKNY